MFILIGLKDHISSMSCLIVEVLELEVMYIEHPLISTLHAFFLLHGYHLLGLK